MQLKIPMDTFIVVNEIPNNRECYKNLYFGEQLCKYGIEMYPHEITDEMLISRYGIDTVFPFGTISSMNELESKIQLNLDMWDNQIDTINEEFVNRQTIKHCNLNNVCTRVNEIDIMLSNTFQHLTVTQIRPMNVMTENESVKQILQQCRMLKNNVKCAQMMILRQNENFFKNDNKMLKTNKEKIMDVSIVTDKIVGEYERSILCSVKKINESKVQLQDMKNENTKLITKSNQHMFELENILLDVELAMLKRSIYSSHLSCISSSPAITSDYYYIHCDLGKKRDCSLDSIDTDNNINVDSSYSLFLSNTLLQCCNTSCLNDVKLNLLSVSSVAGGDDILSGIPHNEVMVQGWTLFLAIHTNTNANFIFCDDKNVQGCTNIQNRNRNSNRNRHGWYNENENYDDHG